MFRTVALLLGPLLVGVAVGTLLQPPTTSIDRGVPESPDSTDLDSFYQDSLNAKQSTIGDLTQENIQLSNRIKELMEELANTPIALPPAEAVEDADLLLGLQGEVDVAALEEVRRGRGRDREPPTEEEVARREEMFGEMRNRMLERWDSEWENASPESQERISAIAEYQQDLMDIGSQMRDAQTDDERAAIMESMGATRDALSQTMRAEQDAQLAGLASKYGITDENQLKKFVDEAQKTLNSNPVFQSGGFGGFGGQRGDRQRGGDRGDQR